MRHEIAAALLLLPGLLISPHILSALPVDEDPRWGTTERTAGAVIEDGVPMSARPLPTTPPRDLLLEDERADAALFGEAPPSLLLEMVDQESWISRDLIGMIGLRSQFLRWRTSRWAPHVRFPVE